MQYTNVNLEALGYTLPPNSISTSELEAELAPVYQRLSLPEGRLELMTGISARRYCDSDTLPGDKSIESGNSAIQDSGIDRNSIGMLVHGSVCRDHLEPATAARVHHELGLSADCHIYDVSNACLGQLNGIIQAANAIELGQIQAALIVGTEDSRHLMHSTINHLNTDLSITRSSIKNTIASLTIGSASSAILLTHRSISTHDNPIVAAAAQSDSRHHKLCHSGRDEAVSDGMHPLMNTDSETLMHEGIQTGVRTFEQFLNRSKWRRDEISRSYCHQVGSAHRKLMLDSLGLPLDRDFTTFQWLGNTGSAALPVTLAIGIEQQAINESENIAMLGIGSGINCLMIAAQLSSVAVGTNTPAADIMSQMS